MQIRSTRITTPKPILTPPALTEPDEIRPIDFAPTAAGLVLGGTTAALGYQLASDFGQEAAQAIIHHGAPLVANGTIPVQWALRALPYVTDRGLQLTVGALSFGAMGFAAGAALLWPRDND